MRLFLQRISKFFLIFILLCVIQILLVLFVKLLLPNNIPLKHNNRSIKDKHVFILGNSHVECAINDSLLPTQYINLAKSGEPLFYSTQKAQRIINSNRVDTIIIEFDNTSLTSIAWVLDNDRLLQHFQENFFSMTWEQFIFLINNNPKKTIKSLLVLNFSNFLKINNLEGGYLYLDRNKLSNPAKIQSSILTRSPKIYNDSLQLKNFESLIDLVKKNKSIHFVITRMPMHQLVSNSNDSSYFSLVEKLLVYQNSTYLDFHKKVNLPDSLFADSTHLNYKGARFFTPIFKKSLALASAGR